MAEDSNLRDVRLEIANTIIRQLGGAGKLKVMVGAKDFLALELGEVVRGGVQFKIPAFGVPRINKVVVKLNTNDLYDVEFYYVRKVTRTMIGQTTAKLVAYDKDVYSDQLKSVFEKATGLYLSMGRVLA